MKTQSKKGLLRNFAFLVVVAIVNNTTTIHQKNRMQTLSEKGKNREDKEKKSPVRCKDNEPVEKGGGGEEYWG